MGHKPMQRPLARCLCGRGRSCLVTACTTRFSFPCIFDSFEFKCVLFATVHVHAVVSECDMPSPSFTVASQLPLSFCFVVARRTGFGICRMGFGLHACLHSVVSFQTCQLGALRTFPLIKLTCAHVGFGFQGLGKHPHVSFQFCGISHFDCMIDLWI